jgi:magnesium transporter
MLKLFHFAPGRAPEEFDQGEMDRRLGDEGSIWIDLSEPSDEEFNSIAERFQWHPLAIEDCRIENHLPKADDYGDYVLLVLHGLDVASDSAEFTSKEVEVFVGPDYLITHHREGMAQITELKDRCERNPALAAKGPAYLLYLLLDSMSDVYLPYLDKIDDRIDNVEKDLLERPEKPTLQKIYELRRDVIGMRRVISPQIEVMRRLGRAEFAVIPDEASPYFRDIHDDLFRIIQSADSYRELLSGALDSYLSALSNEMNQVMKVLTVFASIMLPLTFLAGVWGMNFRHMPELFKPWGYPFALGLMVVTAVSLLWFFRRRRWL